MNYFISLMVNADNSIDMAHARRCPLPYQSSMIDDCIARGKSLQEGGAVYNFTGPQGFGIANATDALYAIKTLVFEQKKVSMEEYKRALADNFGRGFSKERLTFLTREVVDQLAAAGKQVTPEIAAAVAAGFRDLKLPEETVKRYDELLKMIDELPKYGNDICEIDEFARDVAYTYTKPLEQYRNPRGGRFQAGPLSRIRQRSAGSPDRSYPGWKTGQYSHRRWCGTGGRKRCAWPDSHSKLCLSPGSFHCLQRNAV